MLLANIEATLYQLLLDDHWINYWDVHLWFGPIFNVCFGQPYLWRSLAVSLVLGMRMIASILNPNWSLHGNHFFLVVYFLHVVLASLILSGPLLYWSLNILLFHSGIVIILYAQFFMLKISNVPFSISFLFPFVCSIFQRGVSDLLNGR